MLGLRKKPATPYFLRGKGMRCERHPEPRFHGNAGKQRIVAHHDRFLGEPLVWYVVQREPLPAPSEINPYGPMTRDEAIVAPEPVANARPVSTRPCRTYRPTKAEYVRSFAASGPLPPCVRATRDRTVAAVHNIERRLGFNRARYPRRLKRALKGYSFDDLFSAYDRGLMARINHYAASHERRAYRAKVLH